jgi:type I restriction enzyme, S subunit
MSIPKDWKTGKIKDLVKSLDAGVSVNSEDRLVKNGETGVLKVSAVSYGKFLPGEHKVALVEECDRLTIYPRKNRILISRANTPSLVGASVYIDRDYPNLFLPDKLWQTEPRHDDFSIRWLSYLIASDDYRTIISSHATGTSMSMKNISKVDLLNIEIVIPPLREQCRIAEILGVWDESIDLLEKLIMAKHKLKQGLMQQLLTGKKRFEEFNNSQWKKYRFNKIFKRITRKNTIDSSNILTISGNHGLINQREIFNKRIAADNLDGYYLIKKGEFAYNKSYSNGYPLGAIKRLERYEEGVLSTLYICFETFNSSANGDFMAHYFESGIFNKEIYGIAQEGARNHGLLNISVTDFFELLLHLPSLLEQEKIAAVLSAADTEISTLEKQLAAYKQQKCGLMQQLLTGRVRVLELEDKQD